MPPKHGVLVGVTSLHSILNERRPFHEGFKQFYCQTIFKCHPKGVLGGMTPMGLGIVGRRKDTHDFIDWTPEPTSSALPSNFAAVKDSAHSVELNDP
jgi:hypothetical protein